MIYQIKLIDIFNEIISFQYPHTRVDGQNPSLFINLYPLVLTLTSFLFCLLIFLPAGTFNYWNGWLLIILLFIPMFIAGIVMMIKSPELLKKRLNAKEKEVMEI